MKVLIIEDEYHAARRLNKLLSELRPDIKVLDTIDSVEDAVNWFKQHEAPELAFMDIQLADGLSFDIFNQVDLKVPVVFTTAYDQYTLKAFKVNSIDYLLKPIEEEELEKALEKYDEYYTNQQDFDHSSLQRVINSLQSKKTYKQRFLIKQGQSFLYLPVDQIAYLYSKDSISFLIDTKGKRHIITPTIELLKSQLDPADFFQINRGQMIHIQAIDKVDSWFNHRVKIKLTPTTKEEFIVSRNRVKEFKAWLDR